MLFCTGLALYLVLAKIKKKKNNPKKTKTKPTNLHQALCGSFHSMAGVSRLCLVMQVSMEGTTTKSILHWDFFLLKEHAIASLCDLNRLVI